MKLGEIVGSTMDLDDDVASIDVAGLASNSSEVLPGFVFFGLPGSNLDGADFSSNAAAAGAVAVVVSENSNPGDLSIPVIRVPEPRAVLAQAAAQYFGDQPAIIGAVTGTAGKTSVATFLRQIWETVGERAASLGTTGVVAPDREDFGNLTTPDPISLHKLLAELSGDGVTHASMEASSHGLDHHRLDGVKLSVAGFTNLGRDHMDYHATIEDYMSAKMRLFRERLPKGKPAVIFSDDVWSNTAIEAAATAGRDVRTVGRSGEFISLKKVEHQQFRQIIELEHSGEFYRVEFPLAGDFQVANALVAAGMAISTGTAPSKVFQALEGLQGASGRLEFVGKTDAGCPGYVDYAHKPEALENVLKSLRPFTPGRIILVFGCGGDRDKGKRPLMGSIAERFADVVIVTDDNPRTEDPLQIRAEILIACKGAIEVADRAEAIDRACSMLKEGDCVVVAGKGHESGQIVGDTVLPFSDHEVLRKSLGEIRK